METILIAGGAGYKGALLTPKLLNHAYMIVPYDNFIQVSQSILNFSSHPNLEVIDSDIRDAEKLADIFKRCDKVIHLAGIVGYPACAADPEAYGLLSSRS